MSGVIEVDQIKPLTEAEEARRAELEAVIEGNFAAFVAVGLALREINESQLYRITHRTFGDYVKELCDLSRPQAYRLIDAATVVENLSPIGDKVPRNEYQARQLVGLPVARQIELWQTVVEAAGDGPVTAALVRQEVKLSKGEKATKTVKRANRTVGSSLLISPDFKRAFDDLMVQVQAEIDRDWKTTDKGVVIQHLKAIVAAIEA